VARFAQSALDSTSPKVVSIDCPGLKKAISGAAGILQVDDDPTPVALVRSAPLVAVDPESGEAGIGDNWTASADEITATDADWGIAVYVVCADVETDQVP
jgi:hypothetical protein